jgi:hypothetical protein
MAKILIRHLSQILIIIAPAFTLSWSILDWLGYSGAPTNVVQVNYWFIHLSGSKQEVELKIRMALIVTASILVFIHEAYEHYIPERDLKKFRVLYLEDMKKKWRNYLLPDIRVSILHARRLWYFPFIKIFSWTLTDGYAPNDLDANLFLTSRQGVAGIALRKKMPQLADMRERRQASFIERWFLFNQFHLWPWQLHKTGSVKCKLSIPLLIETGELNPRWRSVGVINLDTATDVGAEFLVFYKKDLSEYFVDHGKKIAYLR